MGAKESKGQKQRQSRE